MGVAVTPIQRQYEKSKDPLDTLAQVAQIGATIYGATKGEDTKKPDVTPEAQPKGSGFSVTENDLGDDKMQRRMNHLKNVGRGGI